MKVIKHIAISFVCLALFSCSNGLENKTFYGEDRLNTYEVQFVSDKYCIIIHNFRGYNPETKKMYCIYKYDKPIIKIYKELSGAEKAGEERMIRLIYNGIIEYNMINLSIVSGSSTSNGDPLPELIEKPI